MEKRIVDTNIEGRTASILVWFIYVVSVLAVLARLGTRYAMIRKLEADDYLMLAAQVCIWLLYDDWMVDTSSLCNRLHILVNASRWL